ncbi:hypothetical protein [Uliginosibacterium sp. H1]|uniref:hypothetical protein n=1 Tax=Uliginosibacterium sp. H1 TaxID=3114757 RepID=UPI002E1719C7|nr:hypothetical protein [Uliginosibacterium sp. H1]
MLVASTLAAGVIATGLNTSLQRSDWQAQRDTLRSLHEAKLALVAYALIEDNTPGTLPCPTDRLDGKSGTCGSPATQGFGRLPWYFLGMMNGPGGTGNCLWYGLSAGHKNHGNVSQRGTTNYPAINPGTTGSLSLAQNDGNLVAAAVLLAPGSALGNQLRGTTGNNLCTDGTASEFLDSANSIDNADGNTTYVGAPNDASFNDHAIAITEQDIMRPLLRRILTTFAPASVRSDLKSRIDMTSTTGNLRQLRELNGNTLAFDQFLLSGAPATAANACPYNADATHPPLTTKHPVSWLCFNGWYEQISYESSGSDWSLSVGLPLPSTYRCKMNGSTGSINCGTNV